MSTEDKKNSYSPLIIPDASNIDIGALSPVFGVPNANRRAPAPVNAGPEYIAYNTRGRDFYGRLSFNTGLFWIGGFTSGGVYGLVEGWRTAASPNYKIRFNSVMNALSRRGSVLGSTLGVIAFLHTSSVWAADYVDLEKMSGTGLVTPVFAGMLTGGVYKASRGPRAAALASVIGGAISTVYWYGTNYFTDVILGRGGRY